MRIGSAIALLLALVGLCAEVTAKIERSAAQVLAFKRLNPCPSTGQRRGACPGHQVDHATPLCAGGEDHHRNMQWLSVEDHRIKTQIDLRVCRQLRQISLGP